jgi:hypothetical protein
MRLAWIAVLLLIGQEAWAKCAPPGILFCQAARSEVVFVGRVVEAYPKSERHAISLWRAKLLGPRDSKQWPDQFIPSQTARFLVLEALRGVKDKHLVLHTAMEIHSGYIFEEGKTYFVFAFRDGKTGILTTSGCNQTREFDETDSDVTRARALFAETKRGQLYGYVTSDDQAYFLEYDHAPKPVAGVHITLRSAAEALERTTGADGAYDFSFVPAGRYTISATLNGQPLSQPRELAIQPQSCNAHLFHGPRSPQ